MKQNLGIILRSFGRPLNVSPIAFVSRIVGICSTVPPEFGRARMPGVQHVLLTQFVATCAAGSCLDVCKKSTVPECDFIVALRCGGIV